MDKNQADSIMIFLEKAKMYLTTLYKEAFPNGELADVYPYMFDQCNSVCDFKLISTYDNISDIYEALLSDKQKKDMGQFYTRDKNIIDSMLLSVDLFAGKILEPACGSGAFCTQIILKLIDGLRKNGFSAQKIIDYISDNLYANDIDIDALAIAEINMISAMLPLIIEAKQENPKFVMKKLSLYNCDFTQKNIFKREFSVVIGNPPFVTFYGKRSRNMNEEKRAYFNTFDFVQNKQGNNKFNLSMFFLENGLKLLKKDGLLTYILDVSFLETAFKNMRKYILENYAITSLEFGIKGFQNVASGQVIIVIKNSDGRNQSINIVDNNTRKDYVILQKEWIKPEENYKFGIPLDDIQKTVNNKINSFQELTHLFPGKSLRTCCALTGKTEEFKINSPDDYKGLSFPYIEGSKGIPYKFCKPLPSFFIKYDYDLQISLSNEFKKELEAKGVKNKKRVTLGDSDAYLSPKVFIRQSAREIIATYTEGEYAANNSIYVLSCKKTDEKSVNLLKYACGILNSNLITFYCLINKIIRAENGQTPQIKISDLKKIRIAENENYKHQIIEIVDQLIDEHQRGNLKEELNNIVYAMYGIDEKEIRYIEEYIEKMRHSK